MQLLVVPLVDRHLHITTVSCNDVEVKWRNRSELWGTQEIDTPETGGFPVGFVGPFLRTRMVFSGRRGNSLQERGLRTLFILTESL